MCRQVYFVVVSELTQRLFEEATNSSGDAATANDSGGDVGSSSDFRRRANRTAGTSEALTSECTDGVVCMLPYILAFICLFCFDLVLRYWYMMKTFGEAAVLTRMRIELTLKLNQLEQQTLDRIDPHFVKELLNSQLRDIALTYKGIFEAGI